jgi:hypothetical protein
MHGYAWDNLVYSKLLKLIAEDMGGFHGRLPHVFKRIFGFSGRVYQHGVMSS